MSHRWCGSIDSSAARSRVERRWTGDRAELGTLPPRISMALAPPTHGGAEAGE